MKSSFSFYLQKEKEQFSDITAEEYAIQEIELKGNEKM